MLRLEAGRSRKQKRTIKQLHVDLVAFGYAGERGARIRRYRQERAHAAMSARPRIRVGCRRAQSRPKAEPQPSVPTMMRQLPPGSLDPQARKDSLIHAHAPSTQRDRGGCRQRRMPQADGRGGTRLGLTGMIEPPQAPEVYCR
jgi:hypothetical protein